MQTLRGDRLSSWRPDAFKLLIIDEAHHAAAASYRNVLSYFGVGEHGTRAVGFTATADRLDGKNIGSIFESLAFEYNLRQAVNEGYLVPLDARVLETKPPVDLRDLRITAGDFNMGDLEKKIQENIGTLVNAIVDTNALENRRTIAFTPDVSSGKALAVALSDIGISARSVAGNSPDRAAIIKAHQAGEFQVLVNCMILTEGYDDPEVSAILICRPTKSRSLYSQMVGRGTRLFPGKTDCRIIDFAYITQEHDLVSPVDLYDDQNLPDVVTAKAAEMIREGRETNPELALEMAQEEFESERRVRIQRQMTAARVIKFNPLTISELFDIPLQKAGYDWQDTKPATDKQNQCFEKHSVSK